MEKKFILTLVPFLAISSLHAQDIKEHKTSFAGEIINFVCTSSYAPIWNWYDKNKEGENLAIGGRKHKKFINDRYS